MEGVNAATVFLQDPWISEQPKTGHQNTVGLSLVHSKVLNRRLRCLAAELSLRRLAGYSRNLAGYSRL